MALTNLRKHTTNSYATRKNIKSEKKQAEEKRVFLKKISVLILAAGASSRFNEAPHKNSASKLLLRLNKQPILNHVIDTALSLKPLEVIAVLGCQASKHKRIFSDKDVRTVINNNFQKGVSTSIKAGMKAISSKAYAVIIAQGDMPFVKPQTYFSLVSAFCKYRDAICIPVYHGIRGNPVLFPKAVFKELCSLKGDVGGRALFESKILVQVRVSDPAVLCDIDTEKDYERLKNSLFLRLI